MIAVLTGDLVNSTKMSDSTYTKVIHHLKGLLHDVNDKYGAIGEVYRGDEFQIQYPTPVDALKSTLLIKLALHLSEFSDKPIQCTLSLAYGNYAVYDKKPNTSSGPVFIQSGRGLEKTPRGELSLHFEKETTECDSNQELEIEDQVVLLTQFLNHLLNRLTKTQVQLLYQYIDNDFAEHKKMANLTGTSRQNISNRLSNIGAFLVKDYINVINNKIMRIKGSH